MKDDFKRAGYTGRWAAGRYKREDKVFLRQKSRQRMKMECKVGFIEELAAGITTADRIDDHIHTWHETAGLDMQLYEYLGMTLEEYAGWVERKLSLQDIIEKRKAA